MESYIWRAADVEMMLSTRMRRLRGVLQSSSVEALEKAVDLELFFLSCANSWNRTLGCLTGRMEKVKLPRVLVLLMCRYEETLVWGRQEMR